MRLAVSAFLVAAILGASSNPVFADSARAADAIDALGWLGKIYQATQTLSYTGTFVYQHGDVSETSRITRRADGQLSGEKLEMLDGEPREIVRTGDSISCYLPNSRVIKVDKAGSRRAFPSLLPEHLAQLTENYKIEIGRAKRIAGYDCQEIVLSPRDELRYGYRLWADVASGMLLKALTIDSKGATVEKFTFTQLSIGPVSREMIKSSHATGNWRIEHASVTPADLAKSGWGVGTVLRGFRKIVEVTRVIGQSRTARQLVYSDGLAAVSVFIESLAGRTEEVRSGISNMGAINIYTRQVSRHLITVVGETPQISVQRIGDAVEYRRPDGN